VPEA
jgi:DNA-directed RNA polymerase specialized sigma24 family protein